MTHPQFQRIESIFAAARAVPPGERTALLERECGADEAMRREVEGLLAHDEKPNDLLDATVPVLHRPVVAAAPPRVSGREQSISSRIGPYRILHEIGRGGMGMVYLAERDDGKIQRRVAIKLLKRGMDTDDLLRRFQLERQVLSALDHPGIARLYDAGETADGLPYFVMEYVEGMPVDRYCDSHRLRIEERLTLFQKVCEAVHHAHQNLVVHRDLKPSNIIISAQGQPKLLDFGIAKLLNPGLAVHGDVPTAPDRRVMTPEYASPEQILGHPISTASDIYSLGVLLYQLVSGHRPYRLQSRHMIEMERVICEQEPEKPSTAISRVEVEEIELPTGDTATDTVTPESVSRTRGGRPERLRRRLQGDIDNIVLMAMRKEPQRRYPSAEQFAADIQRHLDGMPVRARPDTVSYRVTKFVQRHRGGVAAAALFVLILIAGIIGTTWGWRVAARERANAQAAATREAGQRQIAEEQRDRADRRFDEVRQLARTFMFDFHDRIEQLDGAIPARELLVTTAQAYLDKLEDEAADNAELMGELAAAYDRVADIRGGLRNPSLGGTENALANYRQALAIRLKLLEAGPDDEAIQAQVAKSHEGIGDMLALLGDVNGAHEAYRESLEIRERIADADPADLEKRRQKAIALLNMGAAELALGRAAAARDHYDRSLALREQLVAEQSGDERLQRDLSTAYMRIGGRLEESGDYEQALEKYQGAVRIRQALLDADAASGRKRRDLAVAHYFAGSAALALGRTEQALEHLRINLDTMIQRREDNPLDARTIRDLAAAREIIGQAYASASDWGAATTHYNAFHELAVQLAGIDAANTQYGMLLAVSHERLGESAEAAGNLDAAVEQARQAVALLERLTTQDPADARLREHHARCLARLGGWLAAAGTRAEALRTLETARTAYRAMAQAGPLAAAVRRDADDVLRRLIDLTLQIDDRQTALNYANEALTLQGGPSPALLRQMARAFAAGGDFARAASLAQQGLDALRADEQAGNAIDRALLEQLDRELASYREQR